MSTLVAFPAVHVQLGNTLVDEHVLGTMESLNVRQQLSAPTQAELVFCNPPEAFLDTVLGNKEQLLEVQLGGQAQSLFRGIVTAVELKYTSSQSCSVYLRGHDPLYALVRRRPVRAHFEMNLVDLARELVGELGIDVEATISGPVRQTLVQHNQSDLQLLRQATDKEGVYFQLRGNRLQLFTLDGSGEQLGLALGRDLLSVEIEVNAGSACREVEVRAWDPWLMEMRQGDATGVPGSSSSLLSPAEDSSLILPNRVAQSDEQAQAWAQGLLDRRIAGEMVLRGVAEGNTDLQPGLGIEIQGVPHHVSGPYVLVSVNHVIDGRQGYVCEIDSTPPPTPSGVEAATATTYGVVSHVADPEGLARIRVVLPTFDEFETDWLDVVMPAAGPDKGLIALPDIGDRVLLLLVNGDPTQGVVLGGVYGSQSPPDAGVEEERVERYSFLTPGGQMIRMDDGASSLRMETTDGQYVEMTPEVVQVGDANGNLMEMSEQRYLIHAATQLEIEAPGDRVFIRGRAIDFERA